MSVTLTELKITEQRFSRLLQDMVDVQHTIRAIIAQLETTNMRATDIVEDRKK